MDVKVLFECQVIFVFMAICKGLSVFVMYVETLFFSYLKMQNTHVYILYLRFLVRWLITILSDIHTSLCVLLVVGAFKATGVQTATTNKTRCGGHGGGALGAQMNLFDRLARVVKVSCGKGVTSSRVPICFSVSIILISWFSIAFLSVVICKCNHKFRRRPGKDFGTNSPRNEWWLDEDASGHCAGTYYTPAFGISSEEIHPVWSMLKFLLASSIFKVLASQKRLENKYKAAQQASDDW